MFLFSFVKGGVKKYAPALLCALLFVLPGMVYARGARADTGSGSKAPKVQFTDSAGRTVALPAKITRIAPSGSLAQMFLLAIAPDMLCAVSGNYSQDEAEFIPDYMKTLPVVGQFYGQANLNPEEIAKIGPDVVIDIGEPKASIAQDMDNISASIAIPTIHITATLESTPEAFRTLGKVLGREEQGEALAVFCEKILAAEKNLVAQVGNNKKSVLYCMGKTGLNVLPATSFHAEILDQMTENKAVVTNPASRGSGNETDLEQLLLWDPEVILFGPDSVYATAASDPTWQQLQAIHDGAYYEVPLGPYNWMGMPPSINRYLGILWLEKILYPEYADYDLYTETAAYYRLFYAYELSRERFDKLTANSLKPGGPAL
ncbi:MAG: ABC transporter substrate-binding protein [Treponema sp.]|jgi:iron complex transport system substrate-binding protein|nr:ABC transporter substrate-binding protein [Treponema sp.]